MTDKDVASEGFSQGGRAVTRFMFKYPNLFGTVSAGGGSYVIEKQIKDSKGYEDDPRDDKKNIYFVGAGNDAWSLAEQHTYSQNFTPKLMLWSGKNDMNYESIQEYHYFLLELGIEHKFHILKDVDHNSFKFYEKDGKSLVEFHLARSESGN